MDFSWLKQILPRGLYGRAALILILPVVIGVVAVDNALAKTALMPLLGMPDDQTTARVITVSSVNVQPGPNSSKSLVLMLSNS